MMEQKKLPFIWELKRDEITSHIVGSPHAIHIDTSAYTPALFNCLNDKGCVVVEELEGFGGLDGIAEVYARERGKHLSGLLSPEESTLFYNKFARPLENEPDATIAFKKGDENEMRRLYLAKQMFTTTLQDRILRTFNPCMVERSLGELRKAPTIIIVDLAHLLIGPTMLKYYQEEKYEVKRVQ